MASGLKSLVVCLGFTIFTSFFLLEDGPSMGRWIERHMGMKPSRSARSCSASLCSARWRW
jgi:predicted PurR-regulated permease PerM